MLGRISEFGPKKKIFMSDENSLFGIFFEIPFGFFDLIGLNI